MAVEIPVYVDIEQAFADAAKRVPAASAPLKKSIEQLNQDLAFYREGMMTFDINSAEFKEAARDFQLVSEAIAVANTQVIAFTTNAGSIKQMNAYLDELNRRWDEMAAKDKFATDGRLTAEAEKLRSEYQMVSAEIQKSGKSLAQIEAEERRLLDLRKKGEQSRKYENAILNTTVKTMRVLQEQERILTARLQTAPVGSQKFQDLSAKLQQVRKDMAAAEAQIRRGGAAYRDLATGSTSATASINTTTAALSRQGGVLQRLSSYVSGYMLLFAGARFVHNIRETTAELELQRVALGGILNDTEKAGELFREIKAAALKSPFEIKDLVTYTKQLAAYRIETDKLFETTQRLADISAGLGVDMNRLILAYGQVRAAAVLRGQELRQFTEAGIPLVDLLAKKFEQLGREGTTTADVFELIQKRAVPFKMIEEIFNDMTNAGGVFYNMQEKQSETLKGQWMKLRDSLTVMYDEMGNTKPIHDAMTSVIKAANNLTRSWREASRWLGVLTSAFVTYKLAAKASVLATNAITAAEARRLAVTKAHTIAMPKFVAAIVGETAAKTASLWMTKQLEIAQYKLATATTVTGKAFWGLYAAIIANPFALAAAAVVGLAAGIYTLVKNSREAAITVDELGMSVSKFNSFAKKDQDVKNLIKVYEELSEKTEKTSEETEKLNRVTNELIKLYPSAVSGIRAETGALELNIKKIKELSKAERDLELDRLRRDKKRTEKQIEDLEAEFNEILKKRAEGGREVGLTANPFLNMFAKVWAPWSEDELANFGQRIAEIREELEKLKPALEDIIEAEDAAMEPFWSGGGVGGGGRAGSGALVGWKQLLKELHDKKMDAGMTQIFTEGDIKSMESMHDLWKATKKGIKETEEELIALKAIQDSLVDDELREQNKEAIDAAQTKLDFWKTVKEKYGFVFGKDSVPYKKDPFLDAMKERIKFMKDFKNGYDDLRKYLSDDKALAEESSIMKTRGLALGISEKDQADAVKNLASWYEKAREEVWKKAQAHGATGSIDSFLSQEIKDTSNRGKALKDFQSLLQSLFDEQTDLETSEAKKNLERALAKLKDDIKRSETAKNFFSDILDLTGDKDFATNMTVSVYGEPGDDLGKRIKDSIRGALEAQKYTDTDPIFKKLTDAADKLDFRDIIKNIDQIPENLQSAVKEAAQAVEKYNVDIAKSYSKLLEQYGNIEDKRKKIHKDAADEIDRIEKGLQLQLSGMRESGASNEAIQEATDRAERAADAVRRGEKEAINALSEDYRLFFNTIGILSTKSAKKVATEQRKILSEQFANGEIDLVKYKRQLKEINEQLKKYEDGVEKASRLIGGDFFGAFADQVKEYAEDIVGLADTIETKNGVWTPNEDSKNFLERVNRVLNMGNFAAIFKKGAKIDVEHEVKIRAEEAFEKAKKEGKSDEGANEAATAAAKSVMTEYGVKMDAAVSEFSDVVAALIVALKHLKSFADFAERYDEDMRRSSGDYSYGRKGGVIVVNGVEMSTDLTWGNISDALGGITGAYEKFKSLDLWGGIQELVDGFSMFNSKVNEANWDIKEQDELLKDLKYAYDRLGVALEDSFGADYIYNFNQQLLVLEAQAEAYRKQAEAERNKGKKADESTAKGYESSAREIEAKISDLRGKIAEFMSGTDLTSAAKAFADSWIEAYKQFGSTTDAMKEKFQEMIQEMITNSLAAKIVQEQLTPIFNMIDQLSRDDGILSVADISAISDKANEIIPMINDSLTTLMTELNATGYNIREQAGQFTGISRNIANATEESINGLAAGINTQNFYMQHIDATVTAILAAMTGESAAGPRSAAASSAGNSYQDQMLEYTAYVPQMHDDMAAIRTMLERVIKPNAVKAEHYVSVRM